MTTLPQIGLDGYTLKEYIQLMFTFLELAPFSVVREKYLDDRDFAALQNFLIKYPEAGDVIPGSGGCRKLRYALEGRGKRGGARVIYFLQLANGRIVLVTMYAKNVRENIDPALLKCLKELFENE
ncbi:MAG: type II toxin-antitoxin system RelE/ParE family toxin [Sulfuricellaceae bacterium]